MSDDCEKSGTFGPVIFAYTREQALADGVLVDVSEMAREAGFVVPVAITAAVHADINAIPPSKSFQSYEGRLWDVLWMGFLAARGAARRSAREGGGCPRELVYTLIMHVGRKSNYSLKIHSGPGDKGEHVITIMQPHED